MPWPVFPFSQITGISGRFYPTYLRWPPETLQVLVVGGGGSGSWEGGGGGGGVREFSFPTGLLPGGQASIPFQVGGTGSQSSFNSANVATGGGNSRAGGTAGDYPGGVGGSPNGYRGGGWLGGGNPFIMAGGGGGAFSGLGGDAGPIGNDYYAGQGAEGYSVSAGAANALGGQTVVGSGGGGGWRDPKYYIWYGHLIRVRAGGTGAGRGGDQNGAVQNGSWYGSGGGGPGGTGQQGVVVVSYAGAQASPSGSVTSYGGSTYHTFTSTGTLEL